MADTVSASNNLSVGIEYINSEDGAKKTGYIKIPNPKSNLTEQQIKNQVGAVITNNVLIDEYDEPVTDTSKILTAYTTAQTIRNLDIGYGD